MLPTQPHHAVSAAYRTPGGLRALDFFMSRINDLTQQSEAPECRILVYGPRATDYVLPFAAMGLDVTARYASETEMSAAKQLAEDVGVTARFQVGDPFVGDELFDAIVLLDGWAAHEDLPDGLSRIRQSLKPDGLLLVSVAKRAVDGHVWPYATATKILREARWLPVRSDNMSAVLAAAYATNLRPAIKRDRNKNFHVMDWFDGQLSRFWPRAWSGAWLFACRPFGAEPLVIQIMPTFSSAGAERVALSLARGLPAKGFQVLTVANVAGGPLEQEFEKNGLRHLVIGRSGALGRFKSFVRLRRLLADTAPAVVQTHLFGADFWGRWAAKTASMKNIVTTEHNVRSDFGWAGELVMRLMSGFSRRYVAISTEVAAYLKGLGISAERIRLVPNGIETSSIAKRASGPMHDVPRLLFVGRLEPQKDPETLLRALARIRMPWELTMVGGGSLEGHLRRLADDLGVASRIHWLGVRQDVPRLYAEHDLFLLPSIYEGFGLVAVEAAVAGLPILAADLKVLRSVLTDDGASFIKPGDTEAWAQGISQAMQNPAPLIERATRLADKDWSRYSVQKMVEGYAEIYREMGDGSRNWKS